MKIWQDSAINLIFPVPNSDTISKRRMNQLKEMVSDEQIDLIQQAITIVSEAPVLYAETVDTYRHILAAGESK